ncbi:hypothetical protein [Pseudomonas sp. Irchel s3b5]|uniref:hypothetical protein n=1 Tax=Pseudomonas sp. Irchel s3b5 TaxID=2009077 RepID=UPI000BA39742|nr:hypothetical protein [Pseudomonas sp. Irchel s3b5]
MKIKLSPVRSDDELEVSKAGDVLTINGELFDFTQLREGDTLPAVAISSKWFKGEINRVGAELELTLILPLPLNYSQEQAFPEPLLEVPDGLVNLPGPLPPKAQEVFSGPQTQDAKV